MPTSSLKLTYEDLLHYPSDGKRHELVDGDHYLVAPSTPWHQTLVGRILFQLANRTWTDGKGTVLPGPLHVVLSDFDVVNPDLIFLAEANRHLIGETHITGPPDLVVEVLSPSTRKYDEITKRKLYELQTDLVPGFDLPLAELFA